MKNTENEIVFALKKARKAKNWTQKELAEKVGLPQSHVSNIERGNVDVRISSLIEIARILDVELMLIPRQEANFIKSIISTKQYNRNHGATTPAYQLDDENDDE